MFGGRIGTMEMAIIGLVFLVVLGPSKIPQLARSLGEGLREFRKGVRNARQELGGALSEAEVAVVQPEAQEGK